MVATLNSCPVASSPGRPERQELDEQSRQGLKANRNELSWFCFCAMEPAVGEASDKRYVWTVRESGNSSCL